MLFNSFSFVVFFAVVLVLHNLPLPWRVKKLNLLLASYLFYAAWSPPFVALIWVSTLTDWWVGRRIANATNARQRRLFLGVSLAVNLGLLGYFKYADFLMQNFVWLLAELGVSYHPAPFDIVLPLGISFYTFQTLSYTIGIYRGQSRPAGSLLDFALFVTFFPQLVAGPIVRAPEFLVQLETPKRTRARQLGWGLALLDLGLFQKIVLADAWMAPISDRVFANPAAAGGADAWIGALAFGCQIYFDFAGYSACAIGAALCLGFVLPRNFNCPYAAVGFADFWRRWHITLSTWLRDYVYFSLLALLRNRRGAAMTSIGLLVTMLVGGLWHGAAWNFVIWGGLHGALLVLDRALRSAFAGVGFFRTRGFGAVIAIATFAVVTITWVFFRVGPLDDALGMVAGMFGAGAQGTVALTGRSEVGGVLGLVAVMLLAQGLLRDADLESVFSRFPRWLRVAVLAIPFLCILVTPGDQRAFIYFQF